MARGRWYGYCSLGFLSNDSMSPHFRRIFDFRVWILVTRHWSLVTGHWLGKCGKIATHPLIHPSPPSTPAPPASPSPPSTPAPPASPVSPSLNERNTDYLLLIRGIRRIDIRQIKGVRGSGDAIAGFTGH